MNIKKAIWFFPPRTVVLVSTVDRRGNQNVAPVAEFINFYDDKHVLISIYKGHDTYKNIKETKEFVVALPPITIAKAISITGKPFPRGVSEFEKANLTPIKAKKVRAPLVKECIVNLECKLVKVAGDCAGDALLIGRIVFASANRKLAGSEEKTRLASNAALHVYKGRVYMNSKGKKVDTKIDYKKI